MRHTIPRQPQFHTGIQGIHNDKYIIYIYFSSQERNLSSQAKLYTCAYHSGDKLNVHMNRGRLFSNKNIFTRQLFVYSVINSPLGAFCRIEFTPTCSQARTCISKLKRNLIAVRLVESYFQPNIV